MLKVLLVDDEILQRQLLMQMIAWEELGMQVAGEAETGREALELAERLEPEIVIMDINIPLLNGIETSRRIKELLPSAQIIILTAYGEFEYAKEALEIGVVGYVLKPLEPEPFLRELHKAKAEIDKENSRYAYIENAHILRKIEYDRSDLLVKLRLFDAPAVDRTIAELFERVEANGLSVELAVFVSVNLYLHYAEFLAEKGLDVRDIGPDQEAFIDRVSRCGTREEIRAAATEVIVGGLKRLSLQTRTATAKKIAEAKRYIEQHYHDSRLSLGEIADHVGMNASYLSNVFKSESGYSLSNYISTLRLNKAKLLLDADPRATVARVAEQVGYSDSFYFSKMFKSCFGVTPSKYMESKK